MAFIFYLLIAHFGDSGSMPVCVVTNNKRSLVSVSALKLSVCFFCICHVRVSTCTLVSSEVKTLKDLNYSSAKI